MAEWLPRLCVLLATTAPPVETRFAQVAPTPLLPGAMVRSQGQMRAVVLIHGLHLHPFSGKLAARAEFRPWQQPNSHLVRALAAEADVFAMTYAQTVSVDEIPAQPDLASDIRRLRQIGYREIVLAGFSAGGVIARQFVEDFPDSGVTRVIQVCTPNAGTGWATVKGIAAAAQKPFVQSLSKQARVQMMRARLGKRIPEHVQFVCVIGAGLVYGDGIVSTHSQWPEDLQWQGVPAVVLDAEHWDAVGGKRGAKVIAQVVRQDWPRWGSLELTAMRKRLWGDR
jgi:pimeloyl-ACP methyl ester carboxylesterase